MNKTKQLRDLALLEDNFEKKVRAFLKEMKGIDEMKAHETLRTAERQAYLRSTGASRVLVSNHQGGKAADLHFVKAPNFPTAGHKRWKTAARIAKKHGIDCGGILWDGWDWNHFQDDGSKPQELVNQPSEWAKSSVEWAREKGLIRDWTNPQGAVTREELAVILERMNVL